MRWRSLRSRGTARLRSVADQWRDLGDRGSVEYCRRSWSLPMGTYLHLQAWSRCRIGSMAVAQAVDIRAMSAADRVVMLSPLLDDNLSLFQAVEDLSVEQLIA